MPLVFRDQTGLDDMLQKHCSIVANKAKSRPNTTVGHPQARSCVGGLSKVNLVQTLRYGVFDDTP